MFQVLPDILNEVNIFLEKLKQEDCFAQKLLA